MSDEEGLTSEEAARRLATVGPNAIEEHHEHLALAFAKKLWGPVPWMLEAAFVIECIMHKTIEAAILAALVLVNAVIGFTQERRAGRALALLRDRLHVEARVRRDGEWTIINASDVVPGDVVHLRAGDLVPADVKILRGNVSIDQSTLTGESLPRELGAEAHAHASAVVQRGECTGVVESTGSRTRFGRTAMLVQDTTVQSHLERLVVGIVRVLVTIDFGLAMLVLAIAIDRGTPLLESASYILMLLVASVPVALPAMFTIAMAVGARQLAHGGVLVSRLPALEEAASMSVLCCDKTGTLTKNELTLTQTVPLASFDADDVVALAASTCDDATPDAIDRAILHAHAASRELPTRIAFSPFDPATKRAEAIVQRAGVRTRVVKGAPAVVAKLATAPTDIDTRLETLARNGARVIAVAAGAETNLAFVGLLAFVDPPREDSSGLVAELRSLGVRVIMVSGDAVETARAMARTLGMRDAASARVADATKVDVIAGVAPEDKFRIVKLLQQTAVVGMTGDGVNDAPALKRADVGIAVSTAVDVAKAAASIVLTRPGLEGVVATVRVGRQIYQRMLTYTLVKVSKTLLVVVFASVGYVVTGRYLVSPRLVLLLLLTNDFVTMSLATDHAIASTAPDRWNLAGLMRASISMAAGWLAFSLVAMIVASRVLSVSVDAQQTFAFLILVFTGQANVYVLRARGYFWRTRPSAWMLAASAVDIVAVTLLATGGVLMARIAPMTVLLLSASVALMLVALDTVKVQLQPKESAP